MTEGKEEGREGKKQVEKRIKRQRSSLRINAEEWISVYNYNEVRG